MLHGNGRNDEKNGKKTEKRRQIYLTNAVSTCILATVVKRFIKEGGRKDVQSLEYKHGYCRDAACGSCCLYAQKNGRALIARK